MKKRTTAGCGKARVTGRAGEVVLCSYGLYPEQITFETLDELRRADVVFLDFPLPRLEAWLGDRPRVIHAGICGGRGRASLLQRARRVAAMARKFKKTAVVSYGNPKFISVFSEALAAECARLKVPLRALNAVSSFDAIISMLPPYSLEKHGLRLVCAIETLKKFLDTETGNLVFSLQNIERPGPIRAALLRELRKYPDSHPVALARCQAEGAACEMKWVTAGTFKGHLETPGLERYTLFVPPLEKK